LISQEHSLFEGWIIASRLRRDGFAGAVRCYLFVWSPAFRRRTLLCCLKAELQTV